MNIVGESHRGHVRERNEDRIDWDKRAGVVVLADGLGGLPFGDEAARLAVERVINIAQAHHGADHTWLESGGDPADLIHLANRAVLSYTERDRRYEGMGTTLALLCTAPDEVAIAHVGDSRIYRLRNSHLKLLTTDHTPVQRALSKGEIDEKQAKYSPERNVLERALGAVTHAEPDVERLARQNGDLYLLCSDGLTAQIADSELEQILNESRDDFLDERCHSLICTALERGGNDNISVILIEL